MEHCIGDTVCIMLHWGVLRVLYMYGNLEIMQNITQYKHKQTPKQNYENPNPRANTTQKTLNPPTSLMMINWKIDEERDCNPTMK